MSMGYIYVIENSVDDQKYIGQTTRDVKQRMVEHLLEARNNRDTKLYRHMNTVGIGNNYIRILIECENSELDKMERAYIKEYDTYRYGLNSTEGGNGEKSATDLRKYNGIIDEYKNGESLINIAIKYNISVHYIASILSKMNICRDTETNIKKKNKAVQVVMYNKIFKPIGKFESIRSVMNWLYNNNYISTRNTFTVYTRIKEAANRGSIAYGYRWQYINDLYYDNIIFNTVYDKQAYINGGRAIKTDNNTFEVDNAVVRKIRETANRNICNRCGGYKDTNAKMCIDCFKEYGVHNTYKHRQMPDSLTVNYPPTKEELMELYPKYTVNSIAGVLGVSYTSVNKLLVKYGIKQGK